MPTIRRLLPAATAALLLCGTPAAAQPSGAISGVVSSETGERLPGVVVEARDASGASRAVAGTDASGRFALAPLPAGRYEVSCRMPGFATATRRGVAVIPGEETPLVIPLRLEVTADLVVTGKKTFRSLSDVESPEESLLGIADSATAGAVTAPQLEARAIQRAGDLLETVPGAVVSQHSGEGKANQYYLRGFNLDHGTDLATTVAGVPVNLPTHAHGQGYTDVNFVIPELVSGIRFEKGPYFAEEGDFSAAGAVHVDYANVLEHPIVRASGGERGWRRLLAAASPRAAGGHALFAVELSENDGPWVRPDECRKTSWVARWSRGDAVDRFSLTGMGYDADWNATDQVPLRAVESGEISRFGAVDGSDGGRSHRYSLSADWQRAGEGSRTRVAAWAVRYGLNLFSNFTYFLDDPVNGDQFEQEDRRTVAGGAASHSWFTRVAGRDVESTAGVQVRRDWIGRLGLYRTRERRRLSTVRRDRVTQTSAAVYWQSSVEWSSKVRTVFGLRGDSYWFDVASDRSENSGQASDARLSPKLSVVLGPWGGTELYVNAGYGFHSNDGRGATQRVDPSTGEPASRVTPLAAARGAELGLRSVPVRGWQTTLALWGLDLDSELVFVGDAGTTDAGRPSRRAGIEWANTFRPSFAPWLLFDADASFSRARFRDDDPAGRRIPGSVETVVSAGASIEGLAGLSGGLRVRYFGSRPLLEDDSVRSPSSTLWSARIARAIGPGLDAGLEIFNLLDAKVSDVDYFYESRLAGEPGGGVPDIHTHPAEPRSVRVSLSKRF